MMHQSLHTLFEVGIGISFGSGATASTVDPLCYPPNFVTDSVYSPGVYSDKEGYVISSTIKKAQSYEQLHYKDGTTPAISWKVDLRGSDCCSSIKEVQACTPSFLP